MINCYGKLLKFDNRWIYEKKTFKRIMKVGRHYTVTYQQLQLYTRGVLMGHADVYSNKKCLYECVYERHFHY